MSSLFQFLFKYKPFLFQKGTIAFESSLPPSLLLALSLSCVILTAYVYRQRSLFRHDHILSLLRKVLLPASLRALVFIIVLIILFRPVLRVSTVFPKENIAAIVIDDSKSMTIQDQGEQSRVTAVRHFLDPKEGIFLAAVRQKFQTRLFRFSRDLQKLNSLEELQSDGNGTSLQACLENVLRESGPAPLASVILVTDGADNLSKDLNSVLHQYQTEKIAVNICAVGEASIGNDIEVGQATAPQKVLPDSITIAVVSLKSTGYAGKQVVLQVKEDGKLVNSTAVTLGGNNEVQLVELKLAPKGKGLKLYNVSLAPEPDEKITLNNSQPLLLNVEDSKPKILYLDGMPRWEFKFIRQALQPDKNLQLMTLLRTSGNKFYRQGIESEDNLATGFPTSKEELFEYKGLMIGDIESSFFTAEQLRLISDFVSVRGGGFTMLGGKNSFDAGKYGNTPIADLLPVVLEQRDPKSSFVRAPTKFKLTSHGLSHLVTRLSTDESENEKRWNSLPEIGEFNWIVSAKPGATVLAQGDRTNSKAILLATHRFGRGRAMAFMPASSWRWQMEMPHEDDSHEIFWRQALRWLVGSAPDPVTLELDQGIYQEEDTVPLNVEVNDPSFTRLNDADVAATVTTPDGKTTELHLKWIVKKDGIYSGEFKPKGKGIHKVNVRATREGKEIGKSEQFFLVTESNLEFYNAGQNKELLRHIASETGGRYYTLADAKNLPEEMAYVERPNSIPQVLPLWDMPVLFLLVCVALISEWGLRKKSGMA